MFLSNIECMCVYLYVWVYCIYVLLYVCVYWGYVCCRCVHVCMSLCGWVTKRVQIVVDSYYNGSPKIVHTPLQCDFLIDSSRCSILSLFDLSLFCMINCSVSNTWTFEAKTKAHGTFNSDSLKAAVTVWKCLDWQVRQYTPKQAAIQAIVRYTVRPCLKVMVCVQK